MRLPGLALLLPLAACFSPNPAFVPYAESSTGTSTGSAATVDSTDSDPTSSTTTTTTAPDTTGSVTSEPLTSTSEPLTSTSEPATSEPLTGSSSSSTGEPPPPPVCDLDKVVDPVRVVRDLSMNAKEITECDEAVPTIWKGALTVQDGKLTMYLNEECKGGGPGLLVGEAWPASKPWTYPCVQTRVYWNKVDGQCRISALRVVEVKDPMMDPVPPVILASLSHPSKPAEFQLWPALIASGMPCGCPVDLPDCCDPNPGQYDLDLGEGHIVGSTQEKTFDRFGLVYRFKNIQSYIGAGCQKDPGSDVHIDWFLELLPQ